MYIYFKYFYFREKSSVELFVIYCTIKLILADVCMFQNII